MVFIADISMRLRVSHGFMFKARCLPRIGVWMRSGICLIALAVCGSPGSFAVAVLAGCSSDDGGYRLTCMVEAALASWVSLSFLAAAC